jgi:hypothetical protein
VVPDGLPPIAHLSGDLKPIIRTEKRQGTMAHWPRKAVLIRRSAEIVWVLLAVPFTISFFADGSWRLFGLWDALMLPAGILFGILALAYLELRADPRLAHREREFVHPAILGTYTLFPILVVVWLILWFGSHPFATIFAVVVLCFADVILLGIVGSLFLALLRLHRSARTHVDAGS